MDAKGSSPSHSDKEFVRIYNEQRKPFFRWVSKRYTLKREDTEDIYQDAVIIFYRHYTSGRYDRTLSSPATYLFGIAKKLILKRTSQPGVNGTDELPDFAEETSPWEAKMETEHNAYVADTLLGRLSEACLKVLTLFFFYRYQSDEVADELGLSSPVSARNRKSQCIKTLRNHFKETAKV